MVGTVGLEPTRDFSQRILSPLRLPIPPRPHHLWRFRSDLNWWSQSCSLLPYHLATEPFRWLPIYNTSTQNKKQEKNYFFYIFLKTIHFSFLVELIWQMTYDKMVNKQEVFYIMQHIIHQLQKEKKLRLLTSTIMIVFSAFMQCYIMNVFMAPCNLISGGFTGLALLINKVCALVNFNFPTQVGIIA